MPTVRVQIGFLGAVVVAATMLMATQNSLGDDFTERRAAAREAIATMKYVDAARQTLKTTLSRSLDTQMKAHPEQQQMLMALQPTMSGLMDQRLPELVDAMADVYAAEFTIDELRTITAFYKTSAGEKLTLGREDLNRKTQLATQAWIRNVMGDLYSKITQALSTSVKNK